MSDSKINSALIQAFVAGAFFAQDKTQWENAAFTPPTAEPWAAVYFVPSQPVVATLGQGGMDRHDGFFQIDINFPANTGTKQCSDKADSIQNAFTVGKGVSYSGQEVKIVSCGRSQGRIVNGFYRVSLTVVYYAHVTRN